jgi:pimeloyl-ACP methyl ester carboxylesterase
MPPTDHLVSTPHGDVAFVDYGGDGEPLVLLHGGSRTLADWAGVIPLLTPTLRVVAVDFHGHGLSSDTGTFDWRNAALDVSAVGEALGLERPSVAGHSLGGMVTCVYAATTGNARGVMNVDGHGGGLAKQFHGIPASEVASQLERLRELSVAELKSSPDFLTAAEVDAELEEVRALVATTDLVWADVREMLLRGYRAKTDGTFVRSPSSEVNVAMYLSIGDLDMPPYYLDLPCPAVILRTSDADDEQADEQTRRMLAAYRVGLTAELDAVTAARPDIVVEHLDCGHMVPLERPEWLARRLLDFAAALPAPTSSTAAS